MTLDRQRCKGVVTYKMDPKFRVSIPVDWRPNSGEPLFLQMSAAYEMPLIKVLSVEAYSHRVSLIEGSELTPARKTLKLGKLAMNCREVLLNEQGKLLIPKDLSEKIGLTADAELVLAGRGLHFEVWSPTNFKRFVACENAEDDNDELGID